MRAGVRVLGLGLRRSKRPLVHRRRTGSIGLRRTGLVAVLGLLLQKSRKQLDLGFFFGADPGVELICPKLSFFCSTMPGILL